MAMTERRETGSGDDALRRVYGASIDGASGPHLSEDDWVRLDGVRGHAWGGPDYGASSVNPDGSKPLANRTSSS